LLELFKLPPGQALKPQGQAYHILGSGLLGVVQHVSGYQPGGLLGRSGKASWETRLSHFCLFRRFALGWISGSGPRIAWALKLSRKCALGIAPPNIRRTFSSWPES